MAGNLLPVANTPVGALASVPLSPGGIGIPSGDFLLLSTGTFVCNGVTPVTVTNANVTANSIVIPTLQTVGGTVGAIPAVKTITPGTGFTIAGTASDTSTYAYIVIG